MQAVELAKQTPKPGATCVVIGHPAAAMLWSVRQGTVSGMGTWPGDRIEVVMQRLFSAPDERQKMQVELGRMLKRRVLVANCA